MAPGLQTLAEKLGRASCWEVVVDPGGLIALEAKRALRLVGLAGVWYTFLGLAGGVRCWRLVLGRFGELGGLRLRGQAGVAGLHLLAGRLREAGGLIAAFFLQHAGERHSVVSAVPAPALLEVRVVLGRWGGVPGTLQGQA